MKKYLLIAMSLLGCCFFLCAEEKIESAADLDAKIAMMEKSGQDCAAGVSKKYGVYIISVFSMEKDPVLKKREIAELALLSGKKNIAAFIGQEMSASQEVVTTSEYQSFKSSISTRVNELLRGIVVHSIKETEKEYKIACFATGRTMDMAAELKKQIESLPPNTVAATGIAYVEKNRVDLAKQQALQNALRLAVEQMLGTEVAAVSQAQDDSRIRSRIYANAFGFVEHYRIISESMVDGYYKTALYAKISREKLLKSYSAYMKAFGNPEFFLETKTLELYQTLVKYFNDMGLKMTSDRKRADYIIDAFGQFRTVTHPLSSKNGTQLSLWIRISDAGSGQELLSQKNDPRRSTVFVGTPDRQMESSVRKAFEQIKKDLHSSLNAMVNRMANNGREVAISIKKYTPESAGILNLISNTLENMPGLTVQNKKMYNNTVTYSALYRGRMDDLEYFLHNSLRNTCPDRTQKLPQTTELSTNQLVLTF
jgi:hypothetical protein